jgi:hypothetical protein
MSGGFGSRLACLAWSKARQGLSSIYCVDLLQGLCSEGRKRDSTLEHFAALSQQLCTIRQLSVLSLTHTEPAF